MNTEQMDAGMLAGGFHDASSSPELDTTLQSRARINLNVYTLWLQGKDARVKSKQPRKVRMYIWKSEI